MFGEAADRPGVGALHRALLVAPGVHQGGELVEGEHDVGAQLVLDPHRHFGGEAVQVAVEVGAEGHPVVVDVGQPGLALGDDVVAGHPDGVHCQHLLETHPEAHHLEAAGVGEGRAGPVHEGTQPAGGLHDVGARLQVQVVGVGQDGLGADGGHRLRQHGLDGGLGTDCDEGGSADLAVRGLDHPGPSGSPGQSGAGPEAETGRGDDGRAGLVRHRHGAVSRRHGRRGPGAGRGRPHRRWRCAAPCRRSAPPCRRRRGRSRPPGRSALPRARR